MAILNEKSKGVIYMLEIVAAGAIPAAPFDTLEAIAAGTVLQLKLQFVFVMVFWTTLWSIKASLMMFYRRLFDGLFSKCLYPSFRHRTNKIRIHVLVVDCGRLLCGNLASINSQQHPCLSPHIQTLLNIRTQCR